MSKKNISWGRVISSSLIILIILTSLFFGGYYIFFSKEKANSIIVLVLFGLSTILSAGFTWVVADGIKQNKIKEFINLVGSEANKLISISFNKNGSVQSAVTNNQIVNNPVNPVNNNLPIR